MLKAGEVDAVAKKKKKSSGLTIYDVLKAPDEVVHNKVPSAIQPKGFHSNAARWNEALAPKTFVMRKKKKKKLSIFKKKILLERLRVHIAANVARAAEVSQGSVQSGQGPSDDSSRVSSMSTKIRICNYVDDIDLGDELEVRETVSELRGLLQPLGSIEEIRILVSTVDDTEGSAYAEVTFTTQGSASSAIAAINGLVCGGRALVATLDCADAVRIEATEKITGNTDLDFSSHYTAEVKPPPSVALYLHNLVSSDGMDDAEEVQEVLSEVKELCQVFGDIHSVWIEPHHRASCVQAVPQLLSCHSAATMLPWCCIVYSDVRSAADAVLVLRDQVVAGNSIHASLLDYNAYTQGHYCDEYLADLFETSGESRNAVRLHGFVTCDEVGSEEEQAEVTENVLSVFAEAGQPVCDEAVQIGLGKDSTVDIEVTLPNLQNCCDARRIIGKMVIGGQPMQADIVQHRIGVPLPRTLCSASGEAVVVVRNYLSADDLQGDSEDLVAAKKDLLALTCTTNTTHDASSDQYVLRVYIHHADNEGQGAHGEQEEAAYVVGVAFTQESATQEAMLHLDERLIAGVPLKAEVGLYHTPVKETVEGSPRTANITLEINAEIPKGAAYSHPGEAFVCIYAEQFSTHTQQPGEDPDRKGPAQPAQDGDEEPGDSAGPAESKYAQAVVLPKLDPHAAPRLPIPLADEPTNAAAKELLKLISTFQLRLKEKNPLKVKQKLRFVCGLKQCINAVKGGKVRLLLLAPNTEANEVMDEKIDLLIGEAQVRQVPVCYCLSKRILGKAVQLSMKQSAIAVLDPDGAYEHFKVIIKFLNPYP